MPSPDRPRPQETAQTQPQPKPQSHHRRNHLMNEPETPQERQERVDREVAAEVARNPKILTPLKAPAPPPPEAVRIIATNRRFITPEAPDATEG